MDKKIYFDLDFASDTSQNDLFEEVCIFYDLDQWEQIILTDHERDEILIKTKEELIARKSKINEVSLIKFESNNSETFYFQFKNKKNKCRFYCRFYSENKIYPSLINYTIKYQTKCLVVNNDVDYYTQCFGVEPSVWEFSEMPIPSYAKRVPAFDYDNPDYKEIDLESLPGHEHVMGYGDELRFGAYFQMYFSDVYYKYIPKPLFDDFKDCKENIILENGLRKITLYDDVNNFQDSRNRERQWALRMQLGIDSIGHELLDISDIDPELPVVITKKSCLKGQTKVTRYLSPENKLVSPSFADKREIKEYLEDGITVVFEKIESLEKRDK